MVSILPLQKMMSSNDEVTQLEAQLQKVKADKATWKAAEEQQVAAEKVAIEARRVAKEKVAAEVRQVEEEWRRVELEECQKVMAAAKAQAVEAEAQWLAEEKLVAAAAVRHKAVLAMAETAAEEVGMESDGGLLLKQKGWVEGEQMVCDRCAIWGFECQVSQM